MEENNAMGSYDQVFVEPGFYVLKIQNDTDAAKEIYHELDSSYIQFHFSLKGSGQFLFNQGNYRLNVSEENSLLLYNTQKDLPIHLSLQPDSWVFSVIMSIQKFHSLFSQDANAIPFLSESFSEKKYYAQEMLTPGMAVVLSQLMNYNLHPSIKRLYIKGKVYELIALYFNRTEDADLEQCPFLADEDNVRKIKKAKDIILERMVEPPTLQELSDGIDLSLKKLKEGFKQIYGDSVYGFLLDHKMDLARQMLESGKHNVNEVGLKVGYSTASHFIAAFKKKYGTTPKKYLTSIVKT
ncbi:AraC family transcriptional regulator [Croceivirga radicis]|uniref:AraC family transcriptional regulator n=1 Tax=Croceivirga radicis TaxID=1929488 RepID=UPI000255B87B|nr:AraC family transcriptional regulator [Croceivirga radicis]